MKTAIVTGCPGQDAYYLVNFLLQKNYNVIGTYRYSSTAISERFRGWPDFRRVCCDITDPEACNNLVSMYRPDEIYNLAAASHVGESFKNPSSVFSINALAVIYLLSAIHRHGKNIRFYQASTSELFGSQYSVDAEGNKYQDENTPFAPNSPYAAAKLAAHNMVRIFRESYGLHASAGILHNHESERRGENFVTRKITKWCGTFHRWISTNNIDIHSLSFNKENIIAGDLSMPKLRLGNTEAVRDWSHSKDMVRAMYLMLQQDTPSDYVLCSGRGRSVTDFLRLAMEEVGIENYTNFYMTDPEFYRPCEVNYLQGRNTLARQKLGWTPEISFEDLVVGMVKNDIVH